MILINCLSVKFAEISLKGSIMKDKKIPNKIVKRSMFRFLLFLISMIIIGQPILDQMMQANTYDYSCHVLVCAWIFAIWCWIREIGF